MKYQRIIDSHGENCAVRRLKIAWKGVVGGLLCLGAWGIGPAVSQTSSADENTHPAASAERGFRLLTEKAYLPYDFDEETFDAAWRFWPEPLRTQAEKATPEQRRQMAFDRYGLTDRPGAPGKPLQYVVDEEKRWTINCFSCHGGKVAGQVIPGLPNANYAMQTLTDETRMVKLLTGKPLTRFDVGSVLVPLGTSRGVTNAVMFGVALMHYRDPDLNVFPDRGPPPGMVHHDMDAPPWWHYRKKKMLYIDGFAEKGHRALMQFMMDKANGPERFREWEDDFRDVEAYLLSLRPPKYPFAIDHEKAKLGEQVFLRACAECHGEYGTKESYPERVVPIDVIGTDPVRLNALSAAQRRSYGDSWFAHFGKKALVESPEGYVAPPLDGVWATAPYFHNGSAPTLRGVLFPEERPTVWRRRSSEYDQINLGLDVETFVEIPAEVTDQRERREYYDVRQFGKGNQGHDFPSVLTEEEREQLLEYLKTL